MGAELRVGALRPGMEANLVAFDRDWNLKLVCFQGKEPEPR